MLESLKAINELKIGNKTVLRTHKWLQYIYLTKEQHINLEQVDSLKKIPKNPVFPYVERTLHLLNEMPLQTREKEIIEEVLVWSEVAKGGMKHQRQEWTEKGIQLSIHNIGSAQIYAAEQMKKKLGQRDLEREELIYLLILTHGLVGQYIRGETRYKQLIPFILWIEEHKEIEYNLQSILFHLNKCIMQGVAENVWTENHNKVKKVIDYIMSGEKEQDWPLKDRLEKLRHLSILKGENFHKEYNRFFKNERLSDFLDRFFKKVDLWYVESALQDFTFEEFLKIYLLICQKVNPLQVQQISFESFMRDIYYDYKGKKSINLYKKRIIESYLSEKTIDDLLDGTISKNEHVEMMIVPSDPLGQIVGVQFRYSRAGEKLIEFCQEAEKSPLYERAIIMLYDFFGFRKDGFDRLQNEQTYLTDMNNGQDQKKIISDYATGDLMLDIGAGGGVMLDLLAENHPNATVVGVDVATNVVEELNRRKFRENKSWFVKQADALDLKKYYRPGSVDTIVFSSILHEMYSYIPFNGKKFNPEVIAEALKSSFDVLSKGGRIIIRDGIMTEAKDQMRLLEFKEPNGMAFFKRYVNDFKGRTIQYEQIDENTVKLPVNDLMEFCYTYTWGEEAYPHEVQEQFGYFTPSEYRKVITETLGDAAQIIEFQHYLQEGYDEFLLPKVKVMDEYGKIVDLPDSTCFIVIEKR